MSVCLQPSPPSDQRRTLLDVRPVLPYSTTMGSVSYLDRNADYQPGVAWHVLSARTDGLPVPLMECAPAGVVPARPRHARDARRLLTISEVRPATHRAQQHSFAGLTRLRGAPSDAPVRGAPLTSVARTLSCPTLPGHRQTGTLAVWDSLACGHSLADTEPEAGAGEHAHGGPTLEVEESASTKKWVAEGRTRSKSKQPGERNHSKSKPTHEPDDQDASTVAGSLGSASTSSELPHVRDREACLTCCGRPGVRSLTNHSFMVCFCDMATLPTSIVHVSAALGSMALMNMCGYELYDICVVLAFASAYFACITQPSLVKGDMAQEEKENLLAVCIFVAHCYVLDNNCPLHVWRDMVLKNRCSMAALNQATVHVLRMRSFRLRVGDENLRRRLKRLLAHANLEED